MILGLCHSNDSGVDKVVPLFLFAGFYLAIAFSFVNSARKQRKAGQQIEVVVGAFSREAHSLRPKLKRAIKPTTPIATMPPMRVEKSVETTAIATAGSLAAQIDSKINFHDARRSSHLHQQPKSPLKMQHLTFKLTQQHTEGNTRLEYSTESQLFRIGGSANVPHAKFRGLPPCF